MSTGLWARLRAFGRTIGSAVSNERLVHASQVISNLAVIIAAVVAYVTYQDAVRTRAVDRTLQFVERAQESPLDTPFKQVRDAVNANARFFEEIARLPPGQRANPEVRKTVSDLILHKGKNGASLQSEIDTLIDYFKTLEICIETGSCNGNVAHSFFSAIAPDLWLVIEPYIYERRQQQPAFALCLEHFIKQTWTGPRCYE